MNWGILRDTGYREPCAFGDRSRQAEEEGNFAVSQVLKFQEPIVTWWQDSSIHDLSWLMSLSPCKFSASHRILARLRGVIYGDLELSGYCGSFGCIKSRANVTCFKGSDCWNLEQSWRYCSSLSKREATSLLFRGQTWIICIRSTRPRKETNLGPSSGGFIANVAVKGTVKLGTQQQFMFRNWRLAAVHAWAGDGGGREALFAQ
jgi:hypothetical protein